MIGELVRALNKRPYVHETEFVGGGVILSGLGI